MARYITNEKMTTCVICKLEFGARSEFVFRYITNGGTKKKGTTKKCPRDCAHYLHLYKCPRCGFTITDFLNRYIDSNWGKVPDGDSIQYERP